MMVSMESETYDIVFSGCTVRDADPQAVRANVAKLFKIPPEKVEALFAGGRKVLKKNLNREAAEKYRAVLKQAGLMVSMVSAASQDRAANAPSAVAKSSTQSAPPVSTPSAGSRASFAIDDPSSQPKAPEPPEESPASVSELADVDSADEDSDDQVAPLDLSDLAVKHPPAEIDTSSLSATDEFEGLDDSPRPQAPEIDVNQYAVDDSIDVLDDTERPSAPIVSTDHLDVSEPGAVMSEKTQVPEPEFDLSGLSAEEDFEGLDEKPKPSEPEISTQHLGLED